MDVSTEDRLIQSLRYSLVADERREDTNELLSNAIRVGLKTNVFDLFDNYLLQNSKTDITNNAIIARILTLCSHFNQLCSESDKSTAKLNENVINGRKLDVSNSLSKISDRFECSDLESGMKCVKQIREDLGIGSEIITDLYNSLVKQLIKKCVKSAFNCLMIENHKTLSPIDKNVWVEARTPARIDLQGGWTDTPPICYEMGGRVINVAIKVNGQKPIGAKARKVELNRNKLIWIKELEPDRRNATELSLNHIDDCLDYSDPDAYGALVKSTLIFCQIIDISSTESLYDQLKNRINCGLEIELWSDLPQGSGLGTSSILAGTLVAVLWTLLGKKFTKTSLINGVLLVEQLMTTGGGWQDQVGGIVGGVKLGRSDAGLPLRVTYESIKMSESFHNFLNQRLLLIYSGSVRLAKNLLQNVIQNWYLRDRQITECFEALLVNTDLCLERLVNQDIEAIGSLLSEYWQQKKLLAPNSEPKAVSDFLKRAQPYIYGGSLCGAGGGGFLLVIIKSPELRPEISDLAKHILPESQLYDCDVDEEGLQLLVDGTALD